MLNQTQRKINEKEQGQSLVELALSFTLILLVLAGAVDFGRAFFALISLRDAAQEGVIYASMNPTDVAGIQQRVQESSDSPIDMETIPNTYIDVSWNINGADYTEGMSTPTLCAGFYDAGGSEESNWVKVAVEYDFPFTMPIIQEFFPGGTLHLVVDDIHTILHPECNP